MKTTYALIKKYPKGYYTEINVIAVSDDKDKLMQQLPHEVETYLRNRGCDDYAIFTFYLPKIYEPMDYWTHGPFAETEFKVVSAPVL